MIYLEISVCLKNNFPNTVLPLNFFCMPTISVSQAVSWERVTVEPGAESPALSSQWFRCWAVYFFSCVQCIWLLDALPTHHPGAVWAPRGKLCPGLSVSFVVPDSHDPSPELSAVFS